VSRPAACPTGDLAVVHGRIVTLDARRPVAEAVLIREGRVALVGTDAEVLAAAGDAKRLDCAGQTVVPGFVDGHTHVELSCLSREHWIDASGPECDSLAAIADRIRARDRAHDGAWVVCRAAFALHRKVAERRLLTRAELDELVPDRPAAVFAGLHVASLNSRALAELGLLDGAPPRGMTVHRDAGGAPDGVVTEAWERLPSFAAAVVADALERHERELLFANGITTAHTIPFGIGDIRALQQLHAAGRLGARRRIYYHVPRVTTLDALVATGIESGLGDDRLRVGGVKIFVDGDGGDGLGRPLDDTKWSEAELDDFAARAHAAGLQLWMHAVTPAAVRMAARAVARATAADGPGALRHRIEHGADYLDLRDVGLLRDAGVLLVTTPHFLASDAPDGEPIDRAPLRTLVDAGFRPVGATDTTGTVPEGASPLFNIGCAVARSGPQALGVEEALRLFTTWSAEGAFEEHLKGRLAPGLLGDLAVLSDDPFAIPAERLRDVQVDVTVRGGELVHVR